MANRLYAGVAETVKKKARYLSLIVKHYPGRNRSV